MKIGLLSPHYAFNYGAALQAFALKEYLRSVGHDAIILNRRPAHQCAIPSRLGRMARKLEEYSKRNSFLKFEREHLQPKTAPVIFPKDWDNIGLDSFDAVIVGSDQVWRDDYAFNSFGFNMFLDFVGDGIKRISYAPSLGKDSWNSTPEKTERVHELLKKFDAISVREGSSTKVLKDKFGVDSRLVVDPTLLLTAADYERILSLQRKAVPYIATYILDYDEEFKRNIARLSEKLGLPHRDIVARTPKGKLSTILNRFRTVSSVEGWVENIANAEYVVTNSFHGMVFSIIFRKQFIVVMNVNRGAERFKSLLKMFGLEDRLIDTSDSDYARHFERKIDYSKIEPQIEQWREMSKQYLAEALSE